MREVSGIFSYHDSTFHPLRFMMSKPAGPKTWACSAFKFWFLFSSIGSRSANGPATCNLAMEVLEVITTGYATQRSGGVSEPIVLTDCVCCFVLPPPILAKQSLLMACTVQLEDGRETADFAAFVACAFPSHLAMRLEPREL